MASGKVKLNFQTIQLKDGDFIRVTHPDHGERIIEKAQLGESLKLNTSSHPYLLTANISGYEPETAEFIVHKNTAVEVNLELTPLGLTKKKKRQLAIQSYPPTAYPGNLITLVCQPDQSMQAKIRDKQRTFVLEKKTFIWTVNHGDKPVYTIHREDKEAWSVSWDTSGVNPADEYIANLEAVYTYRNRQDNKEEEDIYIFESGPITIRPLSIQKGDVLPVTMKRADIPLTGDITLWSAIRGGTQKLAFANYQAHMDKIMCMGKLDQKSIDAGYSTQQQTMFAGVDRYNLLKVATEAFLMMNCGVLISNDKSKVFEFDMYEESRRLEQNIPRDEFERFWTTYQVPVESKTGQGNGTVQTLPYLALIRAKLKDVPLSNKDQKVAEACFTVLQSKLTKPCFLELIWSYWHEEGMLVQTMNAITQRFQNVRRFGDRDPLAMFETDPLRPLNNMLWGYMQDEIHRLTLPRRVYEYAHQYGLTLQGRAVPPIRPADGRTRFLEAFHNLFLQAYDYHMKSDQTTVVPDGFPVLNALQEVHLLLTEGAHNQFGDLPWAARQEMMMQQWILARPEFREFLPTRIMVALPEPWMDRVDAMKSIQGWTDASVLHFRNLAIFGEQLLLSVRYGAWNEVTDRDQAANWARYWRDEIQGYIHAYRAVTGVDLTLEPADPRQQAARLMQPSIHLRNRMVMQRRQRQLTK